MNNPIDWLLEGPAYVQYRTRVDLLRQAEDEAEVIAARQAMLADPQIQALVTGLAAWPGKVIASHKSASQPFHVLNFLADVGMKASDPGMDMVMDRILARQSELGPFELPMNIGSAYGGTGEDTGSWALCDAPLILYALLKLGLGNHPQVQKALGYLANLVRDNGFPCAVGPELGNWRGPGRKDDPCPYANLAMLKALSQSTSSGESPAAKTAAETLLDLWRYRQVQHPYIFYMGTDFCKLKAPLVWYDLLHVLDTLSSFQWLRGDPRLLEMVGVLTSKADGQGWFTPESVWQVWKEWEFGQKKSPSRWVTLIAWRALMRIESKN